MKLSARLALGALLLLTSVIGAGQTRLTAAAELDSLLVKYDSVVKSVDLHARLRLIHGSWRIKRRPAFGEGSEISSF